MTKDRGIKLLEAIYMGLPDEPFKVYLMINTILNAMATDSNRKKLQETLEGKFRLLREMKWIEEIPPSEIDNHTDYFRKLERPETDENMLTIANELE